LSDAEFDFGSGNTNPETFPVEEFTKASQRAIAKMATALNTYPGKLGHEGLRKLMAQREFEREGVRIDPEHVALTNGSMQAVTLAAETFATGERPVVLMEEFNYSGTINAYNALGIEMMAVQQDGYGMRMDSLAESFARLNNAGRTASFIYTLATYQNPTGAMMPEDRRLELLAIAKDNDCLVVEDNCYGDVHFEGDKPPALYTLSDEVDQIYICSLSKIFAPGVRLGYFYARPPLLDKLLARRQDAGPNTFAASVVAEYLEGRLWEHCDMANAALKRKRDAMLASLESSMGNLCSWTRPVGGLFMWLSLPEDINLERLAQICEQRGVAYAPGSNFYVHGTDIPNIRLAFGFPTEDKIREGVPVLAECIQAARSEAA